MRLVYGNFRQIISIDIHRGISIEFNTFLYQLSDKLIILAHPVSISQIVIKFLLALLLALL